MKIKKPPYPLRLFAYLNRKIPAIQFFRKVLARIFDIQFDRYVRGRGYVDIISLAKNTQIFLWLDEHVDIIIWWEGRYEKIPSLIFCKLLKPGDQLIDVGANIGYYSLLASGIVGKKGKIFAFEPVSKIFHKLSLNTFGHGNIEIFRSACGQQSGDATIYLADKWCTAGSRISAPIENQPVVTEEIKVLRLDDHFEDQRVDVVKIDVEGYEMNVLKGMENILRHNSQIKLFIEINRKLLQMGGSSPEEVFNYLGSYDLRPWKVEYKNKKIKLIPRDKYWGDENLVLFAKKEALIDLEV